MADDPLSGVVSSMRGQRCRPKKSPAGCKRGHAERGAGGQSANALQTTNGPQGAPSPECLSGRANYGNQPKGILFARATSSTL